MMLPSEIIEKRILISVLNWGMGHVSRSIGLIHQLIQQGNLIHIACSENQKKVFQEYFDTVTFIQHNDYPFEFGGKGKFGWDLSKRFSALQQRSKNERMEVERMVEEHQIDVVISDHRYGFISGKVQSIFVTHQFNLPVKWFQQAINRVHKKLMLKFNSIWIMDDSNVRLAGKLSVSRGEKNVHYIGAYSRFMLYNIEKHLKNIPNVLIASGPKIYAQQLVDEVLKNRSSGSIVIVCESGIKVPEQYQRIEGNWREQDKIILSAQRIISRAGYSTIMDIEILKCETELSFTPGQLEQIHLYELHSTSCSS